MEDLPCFPRVYNKDTLVFIEYEKGKKYTWGKEASIEKAATVAAQLEKELQLLEYIKTELNTSLTNIHETLNEHPTTLVNQLIKEALRQKHRQLQKKKKGNTRLHY